MCVLRLIKNMNKRTQNKKIKRNESKYLTKSLRRCDAFRKKGPEYQKVNF